MPARVLSGLPRIAMILALLLALVVPACAPAMRNTASGPVGPERQAELWIEPPAITQRDLFHGPGGPELAPAEGTTFTFKTLDLIGYSGGYDVADASGRGWSVKQGIEVQSEIAASRLLWAVGYHQPPMYLVRHWVLEGGPTPGSKMAGRFRPDMPGIERVSDWSWQENPFVGTRPFRGLIVMNMLINNWDLKSTNNKIYRATAAAQGPERRYVVRDLGAAFGKSRRFPYGTRNNIQDFESQGFIAGVKEGRVQFDYRGRHRELLTDITAADVLWACELVSRLSDRQLDDAFRAAGYGEAERLRFVSKLKAKVAEGLALRDRRSE